MQSLDPREHVLRSKLYRAEIGSRIVLRPRLFTLLDHSLHKRLALICAPAGYGKSTLARSWLSTLAVPSGWLTLDPQDNAPVPFVRYFCSAVQTVYAGALGRILELVNGSVVPQTHVLLQHLMVELEEVSQELVLVLDGFEHIDDPEILRILGDIIQHAPRTFHLVLISRAEPALQLTRLRAHDELVEIGAEELRFDQAETCELLSHLTGMEPDPQLAARLVEYSGGWIVGLRLAATSLESGLQSLDQPDQNRATPSAIVDYLALELFSNLSSAEQEFLVRTSILESVCAPLASVLMQGSPDAEAGWQLLQRLAKNNSFVNALDSAKQWFRVHALVRDFLRAQLVQRISSAEISAMHLKACSWLAANGLLDEAFRHAVASGDTEALIEFVVDRRIQLLETSDWKRLDEWYALLPESAIQQRPELILAKAFRAQNARRLQDVSALLARAEALLASQPDHPHLRELQGETALLHGMLAGWSGDGDALIACGTQAIENIPAQRSLMVTAARLIIASGYQVIGQRDHALSLMLDMLQTELNGYRAHAYHVLINLCLYAWQYGREVDLEAMASHLFTYAERRESKEAAAIAHYFLGCASYEQNELHDAIEHFDVVIGNPYHVETIYLVQCGCGLALAHQALDNGEAADEAVRQTWGMLLEIGTTELLPVLQRLRVHLAVLRGEPVAPNTGAVSRAPLAFSFVRGIYDPAFTTVHLLLRRATAESIDQAFQLLGTLRESAERRFRPRALIPALALQALVHDLRGNRRSALAVMAQAVQALEAYGGIRLLVDCGPATARLVAELPASALTPTRRSRLLEAYDERRSDSTPLALSGRELEILRLLDEGCTNQVIAARLFISIGTVKQHTHHIYRKLGVTNRTSALAQARKAGLLT